MFIEPGIFNTAHAKGISFLTDVNNDGNIDQADLDLALKAKASAKVAVADQVSK